MKGLKYTIIKTEEQYSNYCDILEELLLKDDSTLEDEIELVRGASHEFDLELVDDQSFTSVKRDEYRSKKKRSSKKRRGKRR